MGGILTQRHRGRFLVEKYDKKNGTYKSCINPDCDYLHTAEDDAVPAAAEAQAADA